jgi:proline iminopeptidase
MSEDLYHPIDSFASGLLNVAHGNEIYWEVSGNPSGKPALYLHGGPGSGLGSGSYRRRFDPQKYLIVGLDQRGCGRSRPLGTENISELHYNTWNLHQLWPGSRLLIVESEGHGGPQSMKQMRLALDAFA